MKYFYLLLCLLILIQFNATAQRNFKPGYIVTLNGDTTKGSIDYKQWGHLSPTNVTFKNSGGEEKTYAPADIHAFGVNGYENYFASTVSISQNSMAVADLPNYIDTSFVTQKVFLRVIVVGEKLSLFVYEDNIKLRCYVAEGKSTPFELLRSQHLNPTDATKMINVTTYRDQLQRLAATYQTGNALISRLIQDVYYDVDDIKDIIVKINGTTAVKYLEEKRSAYRFFAGIGVNATEMHFNGTQYDRYGKKWSYLPEINAGFDFLSNKNVGKIVWRLEVNLAVSKTEFAHKAETTFPYQPTYYTDSRFGFTRYSINVYPQVLYYFYRTPNFKAYIGGGFAFLNAIYGSKKSEVYVTMNNKTTLESSNLLLNMTRNLASFTGRAGIATKNLQIYCAFDPPSNIMAGAATYQLLLTSYRLGLNYYWGKNSK